MGAAYAKYAMDPNWYIDGLAGLGWQTYKSVRVITLPLSAIANSSYQGQGYRAYGETGYTLRLAVLEDTALEVTPYVGLGYLYAHTDAFAETGAGVESLSVQAMDTDSLATTLGARAATVWRVGDSVFRPALRAGWQHEWLDASATVRATFEQAPGSVMTATGAAFSRASFVGGAGITTDITSSIQVFANYDAKVNGGYVGQVVSGGFHVSF